MTLESRNPSTGVLIQTHAEMTGAEIDTALGAAAAAQREWRRQPIEARAEFLRRLATGLRGGAEEFATLMAAEMGKPLAQGRAEVEKCAAACDFYAENGGAWLEDEAVATGATGAAKSYIRYQPLGVVLAIMPWNFPFWQAVRALAPALLAGNGMLLKHASNVTGCALALGGLVLEAGAPEGLFGVLRLPGAKTSALIDDRRITAVTLTGSTPAGRLVAARAGAALKKCVLELGGSDPLVVLEDADLNLAAAQAVLSRCNNSGQSCIAAKRFIVVDSVLDAFTVRLEEKLRALSWGDPLTGTFDLGPLARIDLRDELHRQVRRSVEQGATLRLGGETPSGPGAFYPPTLLIGIRPGMAAFDEELFGPVAAVISALDEAEALHLAAATSFGLGASVFTRDLARGERIAANEFEAGSCFVNGLVKSDPRLPFGGIKDSGYGRELGAFGLREFVNVKAVVVA